MRSGVLIKTLSNKWGKLNLTTLLFKVGLLTLINMDSLICLDRWCPSLPIILKFLWLMGWLVWLLWGWIGEGSFRCSVYLSPKVLEVFLYVLIITPKVPTLIPIDGITLVDHRVFVLGGDQEVFDGAATFEVSLDAIPSTDLFDTFTKTLCVGYDNMALTLNFSSGSRGTCGTLVISSIICLTGRLTEPFLHLVQSPFGVFTLGESFPEVLLFYFEELRITAHNFGPMGECVYNTELGREVVMAIPL